MLEQRLHRVLRAVDDVQHALGEACLEKDLRQALAAERRALRRLQDKRVPSHHGEGEHPERNHHREVERRDAGADPDRIAVEVLVDAGRHVPQRAALKQGRRSAREVDDLDASADLAASLFEGFAVVARRDRGKLLEVLFEERLVAEHQAHAFHDRGS